MVASVGLNDVRITWTGGNASVWWCSTSTGADVSTATVAACRGSTQIDNDAFERWSRSGDGVVPANRAAFDAAHTPGNAIYFQLRDADASSNPGPIFAYTRPAPTITVTATVSDNLMGALVSWSFGGWTAEHNGDMNGEVQGRVAGSGAFQTIRLITNPNFGTTTYRHYRGGDPAVMSKYPNPGETWEYRITRLARGYNPDFTITGDSNSIDVPGIFTFTRAEWQGSTNVTLAWTRTNIPAEVSYDLVRCVGTCVPGDLEHSNTPDTPNRHTRLFRSTAPATLQLQDNVATMPLGPQVGTTYSYQIIPTTEGQFPPSNVLTAIPPTDPTAVATHMPPDADLSEGSVVTLDASGSSANEGDTSINSYLWERTGGSPVTFADPTAAMTTFTIPRSSPGPMGNVSIRLTVTDDDNSHNTARVINFAAVNDAPVITASAQAAAMPGEMVEITATGTDVDSEDDNIGFGWACTTADPDGSGGFTPIAVAIANMNARDTRFTAPALTEGGTTVAMLEVTCTVTGDSAGNMVTDEVVINVVADLPTAVATATPSGAAVAEGVRVTLDGSGSTANDGDPTIFRYLWEQVLPSDAAQAAARRVTFQNPNAPITSFVVPQTLPMGDLSLTFRLTVEDGDGEGTTTVNVAVEGDNDAPRFVRPLLPATMSAGPGAVVTLSVQATDVDTADADGDIQYGWNCDVTDVTPVESALPLLGMNFRLNTLLMHLDGTPHYPTSPDLLAPSNMARTVTFVAPMLSNDAGATADTIQVTCGTAAISGGLAITAETTITIVNTNAEIVNKAVLPEVLRHVPAGINRSIFTRIQERQRADGKWK